MSRFLRPLRLPPVIRGPIPSVARQTYATARSPPPAGAYPSPPRLPPEEQAEFERLQKQAMEGLLSSDSNTTTSSSQSQKDSSTSNQESSSPSSGQGSGSAFFRNADAEFAGHVNPKTGEAGGPKTEPLRWGGKGDWSYNGKVTDF